MQSFLCVYLILACLVASVVSLSPHYDRRDVGLAPGAYWEGHHIVVNPIESREEEVDHDNAAIHKEDSSEGSILAEDDSASPPLVANSTLVTNVTIGGESPALAGFPAEPKRLFTEARMGGAYHHVGTLRKKRLEKAIYDCLIWQCPLKHGLTPCNAKNTKECWIDYIVYNANPQPTYATNAYLAVTINYAYHNPAWQGIGEAAYRAVAALYRLATDHPGNCYVVNFKDSRATTMCNIPEMASVGFPVNENHPKGDAGEVQAMAAISIKFNGQTNEGSYDIHNPAGVFEKSIKERFKNVELPRFAAAIQRPEEDLDTRVNLKYPSRKCKEWWWYEDAKCNLGSAGDMSTNGSSPGTGMGQS